MEIFLLVMGFAITFYFLEQIKITLKQDSDEWREWRETQERDELLRFHFPHTFPLLRDRIREFWELQEESREWWNTHGKYILDDEGAPEASGFEILKNLAKDKQSLRDYAKYKDDINKLAVELAKDLQEHEATVWEQEHTLYRWCDDVRKSLNDLMTTSDTVYLSPRQNFTQPFPKKNNHKCPLEDDDVVIELQPKKKK